MTRLTIAFTAIIAMAEKQRGTITKLAKEYLISRSFVYMLANSLMEEKEKYYYAVAEQKNFGKFDEIKEKILKELDEIVQSSSMLECINSIVRQLMVQQKLYQPVKKSKTKSASTGLMRLIY